MTKLTVFNYMYEVQNRIELINIYCHCSKTLIERLAALTLGDTDNHFKLYGKWVINSTRFNQPGLLFWSG